MIKNVKPKMKKQPPRPATAVACKELDVWWAHLETIHFTFDAFGPDEHSAVAAMRRGWEKHAKASSATHTWKDVVMDVQTIDVTGGGCWRDRDYKLR